MTTKIILILAFFILNFCNQFTAQTNKDSELYQTILRQDSLLFNVGFNTCDVSQFQKLLSENLKFYHDKDGVSDKNKFLFDIKNGLSKNPETRQVKRFLIKGSTQVFPLYKNGILYGAIQNGEHTFTENPQNPSGIAKFTHVWQLENGAWKLTTSLSYDHQPYQNTAKQYSIFDNETEIKNWLKENKVPALGIGIIEDGKLQDVKVFGEISEGKAAPYNTIFNVASLTKPITAIVALKLISQGKWNLDESLDKYWVDPDIANNSWHKKITTRLVLSHQTGFPNWRGNNENGKLNFDFEPGTKYQYSGEGLEYLRKSLEKKFKKSLQELAAELVFKPLKMEDTSYIWSEKIDSKRIVIGYNNEGKPYNFFKKTTPNAADDLLTTIENYGKFLVSILNKEGLSDKVFNEMITNQVESSRGKHFGLGFEIYNLENGDFALSHGGSDEGVRTLVFIFPKTKKGLLIFTNSDSGGNLYEKIVKHYLGENGQKIIDIETK